VEGVRGDVGVQVTNFLIRGGWRLFERLLGLALLEAQLHGLESDTRVVILWWRWVMVLGRVVVVV
jgi:hypothetical protein